MTNSLKGKNWIGIYRQPEGEKDRSKLGKRPFWRMQENVAKHGARLRDGRETGSDGNAAQIPVFLTERRDILAHVSPCHYSLSTRYGRQQQVVRVKKTGYGKNRCGTNKGHKSKRTRRDTQSIRITDQLTGITTFEPKI
jgi:hypothetical protein